MIIYLIKTHFLLPQDAKKSAQGAKFSAVNPDFFFCHSSNGSARDDFAADVDSPLANQINYSC